MRLHIPQHPIAVRQAPQNACGIPAHSGLTVRCGCSLVCLNSRLGVACAEAGSPLQPHGGGRLTDIAELSSGGLDLLPQRQRPVVIAATRCPIRQLEQHIDTLAARCLRQRCPQILLGHLLQITHRAPLPIGSFFDGNAYDTRPCDYSRGGRVATRHERIE